MTNKHRVQFILNDPESSGLSRGSSSSSSSHQCNVCGKTFSRTGDLTKHLRNVHGGERRFACSFCQKRFTERGNLNKHVKRFHALTKDYVCQISNCRKPFSTSDALLRHRRQVHGL